MDTEEARRVIDAVLDPDTRRRRRTWDEAKDPTFLGDSHDTPIGLITEAQYREALRVERTATQSTPAQRERPGPKRRPENERAIAYAWEQVNQGHSKNKAAAIAVAAMAEQGLTVNEGTVRDVLKERRGN